MKSYKAMTYLNIFLVISLFNIIYSVQIINNFDSVDCPNGRTQFIYEFQEPNIPDIEYGYFWFRFSEYYYFDFIVIDENNTETELSLSQYDAIWYNFTNLKSQNFTFLIKNRGNSLKMRFLDNTNEIHINQNNFNSFSNFRFTSTKIYNPPIPLIFYLEDFPDIPTISCEALSNKAIIYDSNYLMDYCLITEDGCEYKEVDTNVALEKGKQYKIKIHSYKDDNDNGYFFGFQMSTILLKEVEYGYTEFYALQTINYYFYIINIKDKEIINFYVNHNHPDIHYKLISEEEKNNCINEFKDNMFPGNSKKFISASNSLNKDYLLLRIKYYSYNYRGFVFFFTYLNELDTEKEFEIEKGEYGIIKLSNLNDNKYILSSNSKCLSIFYSTSISINFKNILIINNTDISAILVDTRQEKAKFIYYMYEDSDDEDSETKKYELKLLYNNLDNINSKYGPDSIFLRKSSHTIDYIKYIYYFIDIKEQYYLYIKKYYGSNDFYQYNEPNILTNVSQFKKSPINKNEFKLINNDFVNISGYEIFNFFNYYGSLFDLYLHKVNDSEKIVFNSKMFNYNNLVKLLNKNKKYYLDFTVDHLIKLDKKFLNANVSFKDENGNKYLLNKENQIIKNLKGNNVEVISSENALIYFYKRIENDSVFYMEFDKSQKGKNMKFNITSNNDDIREINILKDFSFKGYYPMIDQMSGDKYYFKNGTTTVYIDNWYDKLENDLDENEEEKYIIYIFDYNSNNFIISEPIYMDNLLSPKNVYNFEIIPPTKDGSLILSSTNSQYLEYQFIACNNKEIQFKIENSFYYFGSRYQPNYEYPYTRIINKEEDDLYVTLVQYEHQYKMALFHSFKAKNEFFFFYSFDDYYLCYKNTDSSIISINYKEENIMHILLETGFFKCTGIYYLIIAQKNYLNNYNTFSNPCYLTKLFLEKNDSVIIKEKDDYLFENRIMYVDIDISPFKTNEEITIGIISSNIYRNNGIKFYSPIEYKIGKNPVIEFKLGEIVNYSYKNKNYFKYEYNHQSEEPKNLSLFFFYDRNFILLVINGENKEEIKCEDTLVNITLTKTGTYYFQIYSEIRNLDYQGKFIAFIPGEYIDVIDLSKKKYYQNTKIEVYSYLVESFMYKVENLTEDKLFCFSYDDEINPFAIYDHDKNELSENIQMYKFLQGKEYTIYINFIEERSGKFYLPEYSFESISDDSIEEIDFGYRVTQDAKIYYINLKNKDEFKIYEAYTQHIFLTYTNDSISLNNLNELNFKEVHISNYLTIRKNDYDNYLVLFIIPLNTQNSFIFILNQIFIITSDISLPIKAEENALLLPDLLFNRPRGVYSNYNMVVNYISTIKNMRFMASNISNEKYDFIMQNYLGLPVYVEPCQEDAEIYIYKIDPRYSFFAGFNDNLLDYYISSYEMLNLGFNINNLLQINFRINTDYIAFYEFFNFYLKNFKNDNIKIYIKKYYGNSNFYICNSDSIDNKKLSFLRYPITNWDGSELLYNKINIFSGSNLIYGYLDSNSYFDIFLDAYDNDTNIIIPDASSSISNSIAKHLKEGIEYNLDFVADHLVKIEPLSNDEPIVSIYDEFETKAILNSENMTAKIKGYPLKISSNTDIMVYFYGKLSNGLKQIKIDPSQTGKNYEIKLPENSLYILDFGFEGYNPVDISTLLNKKEISDEETILYVENIYDKLTTELIKDEYLYLYYIPLYSEDKVEISYEYENINNPLSYYTFNVIPKNSEEKKSLIINNINNDKIKYQVVFCKSPETIEVYSHESNSSINIFEFNNEIREMRQNISLNSFKLTFKSKEDFVFHYSFIDSIDDKLYHSSDYTKLREEITNPTILSVTKKNKTDLNSDLFYIVLQPNYRYSSTQYIYVIGDINENNTIENVSNPCYITTLINEKRKGIDTYYSYNVEGQNDIKVSININAPQNQAIEYFLAIVSKEIRYDKKIYFYKPFIFLNSRENIIKCETESFQSFDIINNKKYFEFDYTKESNANEIIFLNYELESENENDILVKIYNPSGYVESFNINNNAGYVPFLGDNNGTYNIYFNTSLKQKLKLGNNNNIKGQFRIVSSKSPFSIDISKDNIVFNEFNMTENVSNSLVFKVDSLQKNYIKKISIGNHDFDELKEIISINENNTEYKPLNFNYFIFEKNSNYTVNINFNQKGGNSILEKIIIKDFSNEYIQELSKGDKIYEDLNDRFLIINWANLEGVEVIVKKNNPRFLLSEITEEQSKNLEKEFQNINFKKLDSLNLNITKPNNTNYSILMVELFEPGTEISFKLKNDKIDDSSDDDDDGGISTLAVVLISIFGVLLLIIIIFFVLRYFRTKKDNIDFDGQTKTLDNQKLLNEI